MKVKCDLKKKTTTRYLSVAFACAVYATSHKAHVNQNCQNISLPPISYFNKTFSLSPHRTPFLFFPDFISSLPACLGLFVWRASFARHDMEVRQRWPARAWRKATGRDHSKGEETEVKERRVELSCRGKIRSRGGALRPREGGRVQDIDNLECLGGGFVSRPLTVLLNRVD